MIDLYYCGRINRVKRFIKNIVEIFIVEINEKGRDVEKEGEIVQ